MGHFDQGRIGHDRTKPTSIGYAGMNLEELDGMRLLGSSVPSEWRDTRDLSRKIALTKEWVAWAPGLKEALVVATQKELPGTLTVKAMGKKMDKEAWMAHVMNDHYPSRRDCKTCVQAAGRSKMHKRIQHPEAYTLSIDLSGKMSVGRDQLAGPSAKYLVVGVYTFPVSKQGQPIITPWKEEDEADKELPGADAALPGVDAELRSRCQ